MIQQYQRLIIIQYCLIKLGQLKYKVDLMLIKNQKQTFIIMSKMKSKIH